MNSFIISSHFQDPEYRVYFVTEGKNKKPRPCISIGPNWMRQNNQIKKIADPLVAIRYHDGGGNVAKDRDVMHDSCLLKDSIRIRERIKKAIVTISSFHATSSIFVGYCLSETCEIEDGKKNRDLKRSLNVHEVLGNDFGLSLKERAFLEITISLLVLQGNDAPFNAVQARENFQIITTQKKVDWQIFSHKQRVCTNPELHFLDMGLKYNKKAADHSFILIILFRRFYEICTSSKLASRSLIKYFFWFTRNRSFCDGTCRPWHFKTHYFRWFWNLVANRRNFDCCQISIQECAVD